MQISLPAAISTHAVKTRKLLPSVVLIALLVPLLLLLLLLPLLVLLLLPSLLLFSASLSALVLLCISRPCPCIPQRTCPRVWWLNMSASGAITHTLLGPLLLLLLLLLGPLLLLLLLVPLLLLLVPLLLLLLLLLLVPLLLLSMS